MAARKNISNLLEYADIRLDGVRPWDIRVHNDELFNAVVHKGTLGAGEAYMDGWWDCDALDEMFCKAIQAHLEQRFSHNLSAAALKIYNTLFNLQSRKRAWQVAETHYNFDNAMFECMLGPTMNYSCGYWAAADNLDEAQEAKMDLIARKLHLEPGMKVLDIGCGWGSLARWLAEKYGANVAAITVSREQFAWATERDREGRVNWILEDYRNLEGRFDRIVSVGMFEHVGCRNYREFMEITRRLLESDGLFLLHTIGSNYQKAGADPWINKYIFPNGMIPSEENVTRAFGKLYVMEDWQNFGAYYDKTLMAWEKRFENGYRAGAFKTTERARRMFRYYLLSCAGAFRARDLQLWQLVLSPRGVPGGYISVR